MLANSPIHAVVEQLIEAVLTFDPDTRRRLRALDHRCIRVQITSPAVELTLLLKDGRVSVVSDSAGEPDTVIRGSLLALHSLIGSNAALYRGDVSIHGDIATGQELKRILAAIDPDWEERLSQALAVLLPPMLGDSLVHRLTTFSRGLEQWLSRSHASLSQNARDYLQEETLLLPVSAEVADFIDEVDRLRSASDRLAARIKRLEACE